MARVILYQFAPDHGLESGSSFCMKVQRALCLKEIEHEIVNVAPTQISKLNPKFRKLPVLDLEDRRVVDSTSILDALEAHEGEPPLKPSDPRDRALDAVLEDWADEAFYWFMVYARWCIDRHFETFAKEAFSRLPPPLRWIVPAAARRSAVAQCRGQGIGRDDEAGFMARLEATLDHLDTLLADRPFLVDDRIRGADLAVFVVARSLAVEYMESTRQLVLARPALVRWLRAVDEKTLPRKAKPLEPAKAEMASA